MLESLRELADIHYGKSPAGVACDDSEIPIMGTGGIYGRASRALFSGPAIIVPRKGSLGNPQFISSPFWASDTTYAVLPKPNIDPRWLYYCLYSYDLTKLNEATGVPSINRDWLYRIKILTPSFEVQRQISKIVSIMDAAIEKTEVLIRKYEQVKQGLMQDLFTRGIDSNGKLRASHEEAPQLYKNSSLGWIPKEWDVVHFRSVLISNLQNGYFKKPSLVGKGYKLINVSELYQPLGIDTDDPSVERVEANEADFKRYGVQEGDLFFTRSSLVLSGIAQCNILKNLKEPTLFECHVIRARPDKAIVDPMFLSFYFQTFKPRQQLMSKAKHTTMTTIAQPDIVSISVLKPSENEQKLITKRLLEIMCLIHEENNYLSKLIKKKQGLMQDLLVGRVPVRINKKVVS